MSKDAWQKMAKRELDEQDRLNREYVNCLLSGVGRRRMADALEKLWKDYIAQRRAEVSKAKKRRKA